MNSYTYKKTLLILKADGDEHKLNNIIADIFRDGYRRCKSDIRNR